MSLRTPLSLSPCSAVNMAGPSSSLQEQVDKLNALTLAELYKGDDRNEGLVKDLQKQLEILEAQISRQTSGEVQHHGSVLCCQASLASG